MFSIMVQIPKISVRIQMERSVSLSSDRNIGDHLFVVPFLTNRVFVLIKELGK